MTINDLGFPLVKMFVLFKRGHYEEQMPCVC